MDEQTAVRIAKVRPTDVQSSSLLAAVARGEAPIAMLLELLAQDEIILDDKQEN